MMRTQCNPQFAVVSMHAPAPLRHFRSQLGQFKCKTHHVKFMVDDGDVQVGLALVGAR